MPIQCIRGTQAALDLQASSLGKLHSAFKTRKTRRKRKQSWWRLLLGFRECELQLMRVVGGGAVRNGRKLHWRHRPQNCKQRRSLKQRRIQLSNFRRRWLLKKQLLRRRQCRHWQCRTPRRPCRGQGGADGGCPDCPHCSLTTRIVKQKETESRQANPHKDSQVTAVQPLTWQVRRGRTIRANTSGRTLN